MESIVYQDSPLAAYLEGAGEAENQTNPLAQAVPPLSPPPDQPSFAPDGAPRGFARLKKNIPAALRLQAPQTNNAVLRFRRHCTHMLQSKLMGSKDSDFLDRFHYILVGSQLLNDHGCTQGYNPRLTLQNTAANQDVQDDFKPAHTAWGAVATAFAAFIVAWSIHWARALVQARSETWRLCLALSIFAASIAAVYWFLKRQWVIYFRRQVIGAASSLVTNAQAFDAASAATVSLIQEVELVSRGYRISSPLPPISRMEDQNQTRRCARLRRVLRESLGPSLLLYAESYSSLRDFATELDLERYADIYEVSRSDIDEVQAFAAGGQEEFGEPESLKSLKISLQRLHTTGKLYLCCLLAIKSDGSKASFAHWTKALDSMHQISSASASAASSLDTILSEESRFPASAPQTPSKPSSYTPSQERLRAQIRRFGSLGQGTRELQAKVYLLREECERALDDSSEEASTTTTLSNPSFTSATAQDGSKLLDQYDSFGADLKNLLHEWQSGRAALAAHILENKRQSSSSCRQSLSASTLPYSPSSSSLSGLTAVGSGGGGNNGGPAEALKILNGEIISVPPLFSPTEMTSSDEEVFEAVALSPRQSMAAKRSSGARFLSREERIARMKDERVRLQGVRERQDAGRSMMRELETVIKFRPKGSKVDDESVTGLRAPRVTSL